MSWGTTAGIQTPFPFGNANAYTPDVMWVANNWFVNRAPLFTRLPKLPLNNLSFFMHNDTFRPRTTTLGAAYTSTGTSLTVANTTGIDVGDVLEIDSQRFIVTAINNATTLTVAFAQEGTSQANHNNNSVVTIVTSAETGAAVDKNAMSRLPSAVQQFAQTFQKSYQVGGSLQSTGAFMGGAVTPLDRDRMMAIQHTLDDAERAMYYGRGQALSSTVTRQTMKGVTTLLTTNNVTSPTNGSTYKPSDLIRDTVQRCYDNGGAPDKLFVSSGFLTGLSIWGFELQRYAPGVTELGIQIDRFMVSFLPGIEIIPCPLMGTSTSFQALAITSNEVDVRVKRALFDKPRGSRGDAIEGDIIAELALEVENESHHAWVQGITGFARQS